MALLGDNSSGVELVIPSENIEKDSASGYVRESGGRGDVYIANVINETDIQRVMAKPVSGNIVVNHVLQDIDKRGPTFKKLGGK